MEIITGIKDYIIKCRKSNIPDSKIIEILKKSNWPEDVINEAIYQADFVVPKVKEADINNNKEQINNINEQNNNNITNIIKDNNIKNSNTNNQITNQSLSTNTNNDLFTKPPILEEKKVNIIEEKPKKVFSYWVIVALLLSPIPLIGLGISMSVLDYVNKNNYNGKILAYLSLIISLLVIFYIIYIMYQIFTLNPSELTGFSKTIVEKFNLL
ncbi:MAG: hypothetical protein QXM96_03955 [Candidatus Woesearchaeota archaeon]